MAIYIYIESIIWNRRIRNKNRRGMSMGMSVKINCQNPQSDASHLHVTSKQRGGTCPHQRTRPAGSRSSIKTAKSTHHHQKANEHFRYEYQTRCAARTARRPSFLLWSARASEEAGGARVVPLEYAQAERERSSNQPAHPGQPGPVLHILK